MPALIPVAIAAGSAIAGAVAAHKQANATRDAARLQTDSTDRAARLQVDSNDKAAEIQGKSAAEELAFKRQQAETDWRNSQQIARANYDQWAAGRGRIRSLGAMTGIDIGGDPAFVPGIDPRFDTNNGPPVLGGPGAPTGPPSAGPAGAVDGSPQSISAFFKSRGVSDHETPYWAGKWPELVARGREINDPNYPMTRLLAADVFGGGRGAAPAAAQAPMSMATMAYGAPPPSAINAPGVTGQQFNPYVKRAPYSFADMVR